MEKTFADDTTQGDDTAWADRCEYWTGFPAEKKNRGRPPRHSDRPLILTGHGVRLRVDQGCLLVKSGFTHYPQAVEEYRFFPADRQKPARIIIIDGNGSISLDVLSWLTTHDIPLVRLDWRGNVATVLSNNYGPDHKLVHRQLQAQARPLPIAISLIVQKLKNCIATLQVLPPNERLQTAIGRISADVKELSRTPPKSLKALRGIEGRSALLYFSAWRYLRIKWKGLGRRPIPSDWHWIGPRTSANNIKGSNREASHPVNAILNYAYAILESHVRIEIISRGYDPTIGYLHAFEKYRAALVCDLMEPLRPIVDRVVLKLVQSQTFQRADFTIHKEGVCRLNPEMAKQIVGMLGLQLSSTELFEGPGSLPALISTTAPAARLSARHKVLNL
jgi:CRISPR-associated endonuclease Cas1